MNHVIRANQNAI